MYEWTISRYGVNDKNANNIWVIPKGGDVNEYDSGSKFPVRPVFYLESNVKYKTGNGDYENPIMIQE